MIDLALVLAFVAWSIATGLRCRREASRNLESYFLAGRTLASWESGLSMAATQYSADTPLLAAGLVATGGVFALWRLWSYGIAFVVLGILLNLTLAVSGLAGTQQIPTASGHDSQNQVKATANKVIPPVVSIASTVMVRDQSFSDDALPFGLFKEPPTRRQYGQGSGVIVTPDGYIVTNNHVVADAVDVEVILADRRRYKGKVVATDPKTDVAVVKIHASNPCQQQSGGIRAISPWAILCSPSAIRWD